MLKIIGETLLIATRMDRVFEPDRYARALPETDAVIRARDEAAKASR